MMSAKVTKFSDQRMRGIVAIRELSDFGTHSFGARIPGRCTVLKEVFELKHSIKNKEQFVRIAIDELAQRTSAISSEYARDIAK